VPIVVLFGLVWDLRLRLHPEFKELVHLDVCCGPQILNHSLKRLGVSCSSGLHGQRFGFVASVQVELLTFAWLGVHTVLLLLPSDSPS
jgi:hypothetical protein